MALNHVSTEGSMLVCLSSAPSNARIVRTAARMAQAFHRPLIALFVETSAFADSSPEDKKRLLENQRLARELGAETVTVYGEDVPYQIAEYARASGAGRIVLGRSAMRNRRPWNKPVLMDNLLTYAPDIDIHIIPDKQAEAAWRKPRTRMSVSGILPNALKSVGIFLATTALCELFFRLGFTSANIILVFILGVVLTAVVTSGKLYSLISALASVIAFNFLFIQPRFSLAAYEYGYPVTFIVMFLTALITSTLASRYKEQAGQSAKIAHRTQTLFDASQLLAKAKSREEIFCTAGEQVQRLLGRDTVVFENLDGTLSKPWLFQADAARPQKPDEDLSAALWSLNHNHAAGATTKQYPEACYYYLSIRASERVYGVLGVEISAFPLDAAEKSTLLSVLSEVGLALENENNAREKEAAAVLARSERLRANLLRSISHDLRTPLTTISGNAASLLQEGSALDEQTRRQLCSDIFSDAQWLNNLVENLLYSTRIEDGRMTLQTQPELVGDLLEEAARHLERLPCSQSLKVQTDCGLLLVRADAKLIVQVLVNLTDNAFRYTPPEAEVTITAEKRVTEVAFRVADTGNGIPDAEKEKVFDKFYSGENHIADNRRSLGLGLYLCRLIVEAHGGTIMLTDNQPHGAVFTFTLPLEEVTEYEQPE